MCLFTFAAISYMYIFKKVYSMPSMWCHILWFLCVYVCTVLQQREGEAVTHLFFAVSTLKFSVFVSKMSYKIWASYVRHMSHRLFITLMSNIRSSAVHSNGLHELRICVPNLPKTYLTFCSFEDSIYIFVSVIWCYCCIFFNWGIISPLSPRRIRVLFYVVFKLVVFWR